MTEDEFDLLANLKDRYWSDFSRLVNRTLKQAPEHLQEDLKEMLQESSSVYGRDTDA